MTSEATTITAAVASTRMARRCAERVKEGATRRAVATTKSAVAALSVLKPISSNFGTEKNPSISLYSTRRRRVRMPKCGGARSYGRTLANLRRSDRVNSLHGAVGLSRTLGFWKILHCVGFDGAR